VAKTKSAPLLKPSDAIALEDATEPKKRKKPSALSPTKRALALCKKNGWVAGIVEKWNQWAKVRQDLFGFIDLVVLDERQGVLALQVTADNGGAVAARQAKIAALPASAAWLRVGGRIEVWGWGKKGAAGKRKLWTLRRVMASLVGDKVEWSPMEDGTSSSHRPRSAPTDGLHPALGHTCPLCHAKPGAWCRSTVTGFTDAQGNPLPPSLRGTLHEERIRVAEDHEAPRDVIRRDANGTIVIPEPFATVREALDARGDSVTP